MKARLNILISGGTGAGKTTLLNVMSSFISEDERIVTIEDAAELKLRQEHVARMETRPPNIEGTGAIRIRELVINALRMRPDRIIVGEVRGEEALDMLQAMNTGHDGSLTTIHANTPRDAFGRLEVMVGMANANMGMRAIRQQVSSAIDLVVQIARMSDGSRRVVALTECVGMEGDLITMQDIFVFEKTGLTDKGRVTGRFRATGIRPQVLRAIARFRRANSRLVVPNRGGVGSAAFMTPVIGIVIFLVLFAVLMVAVGLGSRFLEAARQEADGNHPESGHRPAFEEVETSILVAPTEARSAGCIPRALAAPGWYPDAAAASRPAMGSQPPAGGDGGGRSRRRLPRSDLLQPLGFVLRKHAAFAFVLGGLPYVLRSLQAQMPPEAKWRNSFPTPWTFWRAPCAPATLFRSAWR